MRQIAARFSKVKKSLQYASLVRCVLVTLFTACNLFLLENQCERTGLLEQLFTLVLDGFFATGLIYLQMEKSWLCDEWVACVTMFLFVTSFALLPLAIVLIHECKQGVWIGIAVFHVCSGVVYDVALLTFICAQCFHCRKKEPFTGVINDNKQQLI